MNEKMGNALNGSVASRLLNYWRDPDHGPLGERERVTTDRLDKFEALHGVLLPRDFREFHEKVGGFDQEQHYQDARGFNFWPLMKLARVSEYDGYEFDFPDDSSYFLFCDYLDFSWAYAIRLADGGNDVILIGTNNGRPKRVAPSFSDFVSCYLRDDPVLYP